MTAVIIRRIELENFGPWGGHHVFEFAEEGLTVFASPNERGKTTLLRSVAAILWGYQPASFHWYAPPDAPYRGRLYLVHKNTDGLGATSVKEIRLTRDFHKQQVSAELLGPEGQWIDFFRGKHRRRGRTPDQLAWRDEYIREVFAPISADVFVHLALICQPWTYRLDADLIQKLIVGPGHATAAEVRKRLVERFRAISKFSRQAGIDERDARNPGWLDELKDKATELQREINSFREELGKLNQLAEELEQLEAARKTQAEELERINRQLENLSELRRLRRELAEAEEISSRLDKAVRRVEALENQLRESSQKLARWPRELAELPAGELTDLLHRLASWQASRSLIIPDEELEHRRQTLTADYPALEQFPPDTVDRVDEFLTAVKNAENIREKMRLCEAQLAEHAPRLDHQRRNVVAATIGIAVGIATLVVFALVGNSLGWFSSTGQGFVAGIVGALISAATAAGATLLTFSHYRPLVVSEAFLKASKQLDILKLQAAEAQAALEKASVAIAFCGTQNPQELTRLKERFLRYRRQLIEWETLRAEQQRLKAETQQLRLPAVLETLLAQVGQNVPEAEKSLRELILLRQQIDNCRKEIDTVLESFQCPDFSELQRRGAEAVDRRQNLRRDLENLARSSAQVEELLKAPSDRLDNLWAELSKKRMTLENELSSLREKIEAKKGQLARQEGIISQRGDFNIAQAEIRLEQLKSQIDRGDRQKEALVQAYRLLEKAETSFATSFAPALEAKINSLMGRWTGQKSRVFRVAPDFSLTWQLLDLPKISLPGEPQPLSCDTRILSQGAWDQLSLAVRLAALDVVAGQIQLPLLVDDIFLTWDADRREQFRSGLGELLQGRQMILVTHDPSFLDWGQPVRHTTVS